MALFHHGKPFPVKSLGEKPCHTTEPRHGMRLGTKVTIESTPPGTSIEYVGKLRCYSEL
jgi:hypothetical protein